MKALKVLLLFFWAVAVATVGYGQTAYKPQVSKMSVTGSSTLHEWTSEVSQVDWTGSITVSADNQMSATNVVVTVPVKSIKSAHGKMMDSKTYEAFKYEKNPNIIYRVTGTQTKVVGSETQIDVTGTLTMAGVTKPITLVLKSKQLPNGNLQITSARKLKMTDFNMDPPSAMMGTINVGEEVTVNFEVTLTPTKI